MSDPDVATNYQPVKKRKRKSRWANDDTDKTFIPGMPTTLPADATEDQKEQYLLQLQIEESTRRLRSGDLGIPANPDERSPSPEPIYNNEGKRMNTREYRTRRNLEEGRHDKIQKLLGLNPNYKPPADYKPPIIRVNDKVMIPQDDHPEINFVGLLIGPRGNTLKTLEKETGAKIIIRGKGSVKEGKIGRKDGQPLPGEDEPLHAYITANDPDNVKKAVTRIYEIIKEGIEIPEEKNDLRKQQLRELALLNGTLRDNDSGLQKLRQIAEAETIITNQIICSKCGAAGHIARDCVQKAPAELTQSQMVASEGVDALAANTIVGRQDRAKMDSEYMSLMAELGQVAPETLKAELALKMQTSVATNGRPGGLANVNNAVDSVSSMSGSSAPAAPALSADYGYGGRRSRFDEFDNSRYRGNDSFNRYNTGMTPRFSPGAPPRHPPGHARFDHASPHSRFDQGPPRFDHYPPRYGSGPPPTPPGVSPGNRPSRFDQGPPPPPHFDQTGHDSWNSEQLPPPPPHSNSGRWPPSAAAPPPPPHSAGSGAAPPPPPPPGAWSQPMYDSAAWPQATPPWQSTTNYHESGSMPAPPPPPSAGAPMPPPPPPQ